MLWRKRLTKQLSLAPEEWRVVARDQAALWPLTHLA
jgi:hypothetical protein